MIMIGADSHKRSHTVVALNEVGRRLGQKTVSTDIDIRGTLVRWQAAPTKAGRAGTARRRGFVEQGQKVQRE